MKEGGAKYCFIYKAAFHNKNIPYYNNMAML